MKLGAKEIGPFLKNPAQAAAVLIYGPDRGQMRQRLDMIASEILSDLNDPFNRADFTCDQLVDDPTRLYDELSAMSFTGDRRLIVCSDAGDKHSELFKEALPLLHEQNYLIVCGDDLGARSSLRKLFEGENRLAALPCYKDEGAGLAQLIQDTLRGYGLRADRDAVHYLAHNLGGDRMIILGELEKLSLYLGDEENVDLDTVRLVVGDSADRSFDDICQAVATGQIDTLCRTLDRMYSEGMHSVAIIRSVHRYFTRLLEIHQMMRTGQSVDQVIKSLRPPVFFKQQPLLRQAAVKWNEKRIQNVLHLMLEAEKEAKLGADLSSLLCSQTLLRVARAAA